MTIFISNFDIKNINKTTTQIATDYFTTIITCL